MKSLKVVVVGIGALSLFGCVGVSMHSSHSTPLVVTVLPAGVPASKVRVSVSYDYDSYGWFYFLNTPSATNAVTDDQGRVTNPIADYQYRIILGVESDTVAIDRKLVVEGGRVAVPNSNPRYQVDLKPR